MTDLVRQFHEAFDLERRDAPGVPDEETIELRATLIAEEFAEVIGALYNANDLDTRALAESVRQSVRALTDVMRDDKPERDMAPRMVDLAKELADLRYVTEGTAVSFGIPLDDVYAAVHESNMSKLGEDGCPIYREDGKVTKGPNYTPAEPAVKELLSARDSD